MATPKNANATATATATIDANLAALPADQLAALQALRELIAATAPEAEETISYGMPAFRYHGRTLVWYAGFKTHCSFFPMSLSDLDSFDGELDEFAAGRGTLQFTPERPLPTAIVERIVRDRVALIDAQRPVRRR